MFEAQVAYYLNKYLGQYVDGIDQRSLTISIYAGNVVLKNLRLKPGALEELDLPITVQGGLLGSLTLKVPWNALGRAPVEVSIDSLYLLAVPRVTVDGDGAESSDTNGEEDPLSAAALETAFQRAKLQRVARQEARWLDELQSLEKQRSAPSTKEAKGADGGGGGAGFLRGLIDTIIGNLQLSITNVHVRYEDALTHPGHPFACGFLLEQISASTVDEVGRPTFVTTSALDLLRKALNLRSVAVYFDCNEPGWEPGRSWRELPPEEWATWFHPRVATKPRDTRVSHDDGRSRSTIDSKDGRSEGGSTTLALQQRQYVLQPIDGRATYVRRGRNVQREEDEPASDFDVKVDSIAVSLSREQYQSYSLLLAQLSVYSARRPHQEYRPRVRPTAGKAARAWWQYARLAVKQQSESHRLTWQQVLRFLDLRREYVPLYLQHLRRTSSSQSEPQQQQQQQRQEQDAENPLQLPKDTTAVPEELASMDSVLPENTILMFRRLAYAEFQRERRREARAARAASKSAAQSGGGGWLGWLMGSGGAAPAPAPAPAPSELQPASEETLGEQRAELSAEEYNKLMDWVSQQDEGLKLGMETPYTLLTRIRLAVGSAAAVLSDGDGDGTLLRGSLLGISVETDMYPKTRRLQVGVTAMEVEGPDGIFVQTGARAPDTLGSAEFDRSSSLQAELQEVTSEQALAVYFVQSPQDNSADAIVDVVLTPSYVHYDAPTVQRVTHFFKPPPELQFADMSSLEATATSRLERARRAAAEYAAAALSSKPRLRMRFRLDAPKVSVPITDHRGQVTLALDLGRFIIESDHSTATSLPPEEAGLYECIRLTGSNVSAYVIDGIFDWQRMQHASGGRTPTDTTPTLIPLLERCGLEIGLQAARYEEPRFPSLRLRPTIPLLRFHLSPGRVGRLLRVINGALPAGEEEQVEDFGGGGADGDVGGKTPDEWRLRADRQGDLRVLTWGGLARSTATWCPRHAVLHQGRLYMFENRSDRKAAETHVIWPERRIDRIPSEHVGGCEHVIAVRPAATPATDVERVAEDSSSTVLRFASDQEASEWYRGLLAGQAAMQELSGEANLAAGLAPDWDATSSILSASDTEDAAKSREEVISGGVQGKNKEDESNRPSTMVQIDAVLGEFAIFASGREPVAWWPPEAHEREVAKSAEAGLASKGAACKPSSSLAGSGSDAAHIAGEVPLVIIRASGGSLGLSFGDIGLDIQTALSSFEIQDQLVGGRNPRQCYLASSSAPDSEALQIGDDVFFDPGSRATSGVSSMGSDGFAASLSRDSSESRRSRLPDIAEFSLKLRKPGTPQYEGVDTSLEASLNTLYFYCNRPTVAALISMGLDVADAAAAAYSNEPEEVPTTMQPESGVGGEPAAAAEICSSESTGASQAGLVAQLPLSQAAETLTLTPAGQHGRREGGKDGSDDQGDVEIEVPKRTMFALGVTLKTLQVVLNYEGSDKEALTDASITDFSFALDIAPDGGMEVTSALGNIAAVDRTLPEGHPYRNACGLRPGSAASLVALTFASHPAMHRHPRVPPDTPFYTLQATLSELQTVFLYRFLQEKLQYISTMLAMRLPPLTPDEVDSEQQQDSAAPPSGPTTPRHQPRTAETAPSPSPATTEEASTAPFALVMDVVMNAPIIQLPRTSSSLDAIEVDLGVLHLTSGIEASMVPDGRGKTLVEVAELTFSGVGCSAVQGGRRGRSVVHNPEQGWHLRWKRALEAHRRGDNPFFDLALDVPFIKAALSDTEYALMTSVAAANFSEEPSLPAGARWIAAQHQPIDSDAERASAAAQQAATALQTPPVSPRNTAPTAPKGSTPQDALAKLQSGRSQKVEDSVPSHESQRTAIRVIVSLGEVELELLQSIDGLPQPLPLARFAIAQLCCSYHNTDGGAMRVELSIPRIEVQDQRPNIPLEQSLAISSGHKASFLMLTWEAEAEMTSQSLGIILQKPLLVAELSFLLAVTRFVLPTISLAKETINPFATHDILLVEDSHDASEDLYLSPASRLLADCPQGSAVVEFCGHGHKLVLPPRDCLDEMLPLILVGSGRTLRLRDVTVVNASALPACLQLGAGARLIAQPADGVKMIDGSGTTSPREIDSTTQKGSSGPDQAGGGAAFDEHAAFDEPQLAEERRLKISLAAVGVGIQLVELENGAILGTNSRPSSREALQRRDSASLSVPRSVSASSLQGTTAPLGSKEYAPSRHSARMLAAKMDLNVEYEATGVSQRGKVAVQGLTIDSRTISDARQASKEREQQQFTARRKQQIRGKREAIVLQPCRLLLDFDLLSERQSDGTEGQVLRTDVHLDASDIRLVVSPSTLELAISLGSAALGPLSQPAPDAPVRAVSQFELVWCFDPASMWVQHADVAVNLAVTGAGTGVSVWRPLVPTGYGILGHVVTPGDAKPSFEVFVAAINSGLVAFPASYENIWATADASIWRPVAPPGYVALGDVFVVHHRGEEGAGGKAGPSPPALSEVLCLHQAALIEAAVGQCLPLPPPLPQAPALAAQVAREIPPVDLWCVDNTAGTFIATTSSDGLEHVRGRDLRSPIGLTPAALIASGAATCIAVEEATRARNKKEMASDAEGSSATVTHQDGKLQLTSSPRKLYQEFLSIRRRKRTEEVRRTLTPSIVDFRRIWSDGGAFTHGVGLTAWRPIPPPGYTALGDCIVRGFDPPRSALVVADTGTSNGGGGLGASESQGQFRGMPLVRAPRGYELVWHDGNPRAEFRACFWKPIPHPGYVHMGCVATIGDAPPSRTGIKCLRSDYAVQAPSSRTPLWAVRRADRTLPPLSLWTADEGLGTFVVEASDRMAPPDDMYRLKSPRSGVAEPAGKQGAGKGAIKQRQQRSESVPSVEGLGVNVIARTGGISVLLLDTMNTPLLDMDTVGVEAGIRGPSRQVTQAYLGLRPSVSAYNRALRHWEPVLEPTDVIAKCDANLGPAMEAGIDPGIHLSVKSSAESVFTTLATTHATALLAALAEWNSMRASGDSKKDVKKGSLASLGGIDAGTVETTVFNALGVDAAMELDYGDRLEVAKLTAGNATRVLRPLPQIPRKGYTSLPPRESCPHDLLLVDIEKAILNQSKQRDESQRLFCVARLLGNGVDGIPPPAGGISGGPRTRPVASTAEESDTGHEDTGPTGAGGETREVPATAFVWSERLVLPLPSRPAAHHTIAIEVWDADAAGGQGRKLGAVQIDVPFGKLRERAPHQLTVAVSHADATHAAHQSEEEQDDAVCTLHMGYMLQHQWHAPLPSQGAASDAWNAGEPSTGQRALSLMTVPGSWAVIPTFGQQRSSGGAVTTTTITTTTTTSSSSSKESCETPTSLHTLTPLVVHGQPIVLEAGLKDGAWREMLRAPCQLVNSTSLTLEACLLTDQPDAGDWLLVKSSAAAAAMERELTPSTDAHAVSMVAYLGTTPPGGRVPMPLGWDAPGHRLAIRPIIPGDSDAAPAAEGLGADAEREQALERSTRDAGESTHEWSVLASSSASQTRQPQGMSVESVDEHTTALLACPPRASPRHATATTTATTSQTSADQRQYQNDGEQDGSEDLLGAVAWFSVTIETEILPIGARGQPAVDWSIVVAPPLTLINQLPVPGSCMVWEQQYESRHQGQAQGFTAAPSFFGTSTSTGGSGELIGRLTRRVPSGGRLAVHTADVRRPISLTLYPDGYDWADAGPVVLTAGMVRLPHPPPDRFRIVRPGSRLPVEIFLRRDFELAPLLLEAASKGSESEFDAGAVISRGVPVSVTFLAPLWVVNATNLAIDAAVVPIPRPQTSKRGSSMRAKVEKGMGALEGASGHSSRHASQTLRVLRTSDVPFDPTTQQQKQHQHQQQQEPSGRRTIAPSSLELLSYPLPTFVLGAEASAETKRAQRKQHYGVRLRVAGSGWTHPLALDVVDVSSAGPGDAPAAVDELQSTQPVLIRAESREYGLVFEITARLELATMKASAVLRLEPHVVVSNRTTVPVQLLQCQPAVVSGRTVPQGALGAGQQGAGIVVPEGGISFAPATSSSAVATSASGSTGGAGTAPRVLRPALQSVSRRALGPYLSAPALRLSDKDEATTHEKGTLRVSGSGWTASGSSVSAAALVQVSSDMALANQHQGCILDVPPGAAALPLHSTPGIKGGVVRALCFRCADGSDAEVAAMPLWSRPLIVEEGREDEHHVAVPVVAASFGDETKEEGTASSTAFPAKALGAEGMALLRLSVHTRGPGLVHIVVESAAADPPFLLENRSFVPLQYRQAHVQSAPFHALPPLSAMGYCWEYSVQQGVATELDLREAALGANPEFTKTYQVEAADGGDGAGVAVRCPPLPLSGPPKQCTVRIGYAEAVATSVGGIVAIGGEGTGGALGRGGVDRVLHVAPGRDPLIMAGLKGIAAPPPEMTALFELPGLEVSVIDDLHEEVLLLTVLGLKVEAASGTTPTGPFKSFRCSLQRIQADNQLPGVRYPVLLSPAKHATNTLPMLSFTAVQQLPGTRGRAFFPYIGVRCPEDLQVAVSEPIIWRLASMMDQMSRASGPSDGGAMQAAADAPVRIRLLVVPDLRLSVSFQGDPLSRPRHLTTGMVSMLIDLVNFQAANAIVHGFDWSEVRASRSVFVRDLQQAVQGELLGVALSLVRNFGVIGGASRVLGMLSAGVAKLSGDTKSRTGMGAGSSATGGWAGGGGAKQPAGAGSSSRTAIEDVGEGLLEGAGAFGSSVLRGFRGLVEKPLAGAKATGVEGAVKGMAKGLVGVVANPVSGALDALSATAEGFDASFARSREDLLVVQRRRLPRAVGADGRLESLFRDGSLRQSIIEQLGQALLWNALAAGIPHTSSSSSARGGLQQQHAVGGGAQTSESYVEHFVLPHDVVCILTSQHIMLVHAPGFATLEGAAEVGALAVAPDVPPCNVQWAIMWEDLLSLELRWSDGGMTHPDRLVVHRKGCPGSNNGPPLAFLISCFSETPQASQIKLVATAVLRKCIQEPARADQRWSERHVARSELPSDQPPEQLPLTLPSLDFVATWHSNPARPPQVYFWKPLPPPGYKPVGHVATLGSEQPLMPVPCFRDDCTLQPAALKADAAAPMETTKPPTAPPTDFSLIWRYNGKRAVTIWMPVPPPGYVALGAVVLDQPSMPSMEDYLCVREDLTIPAKVFDSPIWSYDPAPALAAAGAGSAAQSIGERKQTFQPEGWRVTVWPVDSRTGTILAVRGLNRPPGGISRAVKELEDRTRVL